AATAGSHEYRILRSTGRCAPGGAHCAQRSAAKPRPLPARLPGPRADPDRRGRPPADAARASSAGLPRTGARPATAAAGNRPRRRGRAAGFPRREPHSCHRVPALPFLSFMKILVTGSIAYDTIMLFPDRFRNHLLADQLHILNVCFLTPDMRREFGGTAGNIAYNLKLLGEAPLVMATVGEDSGPYLERLQRLGIRTSLLKQIPGQFTAQAFITTDLDDNQITAFHPGAMNYSHENRIGPELGARLAIIAPDGKEGMLQHARECAEQRIDMMFDPGQGLPMFSGQELDGFLRL